ncbi:MAG TPA: 2,4'-dihydroxyacetophenone dioxygenase family protein [Sphingomonadaceae bacterium]|nr:2,4'-dihydroxyacetophenone dioxygenase family protein [Sphingomonadaceae bacterium]
MSDMAENSPPSSTYAIVEIPDPVKETVERFGRPGLFVGANDSPWIPRGPNAMIRNMAFDVRNNAYCNILWIKGPGVIGTHKHRGAVWGVGLEGSFRYLEYDWVCKPGDFIWEPPGQAHTLVTDDPNGMKTIMWMQGANEYFDAKGNWVETVDVFFFIDLYVKHCKASGLPINDALWI